MGFRSYSREFFVAILMLFRPSLPWGLAAGSGSILGCLLDRSSRSRPGEKVAKIINHHFLSISEVTLSSFWVQFCCFSVLHCHLGFQKQCYRVFWLDFASPAAAAAAAACQQQQQQQHASSSSMGICRWEWVDFRLPFGQK